MVWATLQFDSELLLIDPRAKKSKAAPKILERIPVPAPGRGPHVIVEEGDDAAGIMERAKRIQLRLEETLG